MWSSQENHHKQQSLVNSTLRSFLNHNGDEGKSVTEPLHSFHKFRTLQNIITFIFLFLFFIFYRFIHYLTYLSFITFFNSLIWILCHRRQEQTGVNGLTLKSGKISDEQWLLFGWPVPQARAHAGRTEQQNN